MKFGPTAISSASLYPQLTTEAALASIAALGCTEVEVFLQTTSEYQYSYAIKLARLCRRLGLTVHSLHGPAAQYEPLLFYRYRRQNADSFNTLHLIHQAAALLGARCHVFHGPLKGENLALSRLSQGLAKAAAAAGAWGLKLALENVSWCAGHSPAVFQELNRQQINNLFYTFDSKQALRSGYPASEFIGAMGDRLVNVHLSQGNGQLPGADGDFGEIAKALKAAKYSGPIVLEVYGAKVPRLSALGAGWRRLKENFAEI